jgi:ferrous iron transport protein B
MSEKSIKVAIAGNPNCGKTALFNALTGGRQQVGNWPGVTVERRIGAAEYDDHQLEIVDLPGTYSLSPLTPDQVVARDYIASGEPDVVINIVDGSNLERNLYLTTQLLELGVPLVVAVNMMDVVRSRGDELDFAQLSHLLGCPVVPLVAVRGRGVDELLAAVLEVRRGNYPAKNVQVHYGTDLEAAVAEVVAYLEEHPALELGGPSRWQAVRLLEGDEEYTARLEAHGAEGQQLRELVRRLRSRLRGLLGEEPGDHFAEAAYGFAAGAIRETLRRNVRGRTRTTEKIDKVLTHRIWGLPIFLALMWLMFEVTFTLGAPLMDLLERFFAWAGSAVAAAMEPGLWRSLVVDGLIGGVGGVLVFVPNILLLFVMISLLEDSGYMARGAFVMDRFMHKLGLHGKSFIPMIIGFGCTVPAVMAARTLENPKDRLVTILTVPLMSCGARLPVYILLAGAFFPDNAGTVIFGVYLLGVLLAVLAARLLRRTVLKGDQDPFVMELPAYHVPTVKAVLLHAWRRAWMYIKKAGTIILFAMVVIWALTAFPREAPDAAQFEAAELTAAREYAAAAGFALPADFDPGVGHPLPADLAVGADEDDPALSGYRRELEYLADLREASRLRSSPLGYIGRGLSYVMRPLGFDWKISSALVAGFAAKEIVVGTLGVLYAIDAEDAESGELQQLLRADWDARTGGKGWLIALPLMVFVLIYVPCVAVLAVIRRETGSWKWTLFTVVYLTVTAWVVAGAVRLVAGLFA